MLVSGLVEHLRSRRGLLSGMLLLGLLLALVPAPAAPTLDSLAAELSAASGTEVEPHELVWLESRGVLADLAGRDIVFVGRGAESSEVYRARVVLTPGGRSLFVHALRQLSETELADEDGLDARDGWVGWGVRSGGRLRSIELGRVASVGLDGAARRVVIVLPDEAEEARWELGRGVVRLLLGERTVDVPLEGAETSPRSGIGVIEVAESGGLALARPPWTGRADDEAVVPATVTSQEAARGGPEAPEEYEVDARFPSLVPGAPEPVRVRRRGAAVTYHFDGRQVQWRLAPGERAPRSATGARVDAGELGGDRMGAVLATIRWGAPSRGGGSAGYAFDGVSYGALNGAIPQLWIHSRGGLVLEPAGGARSALAPAHSHASLLGRPSARSAVAFCTTSWGHWVVADSGEGEESARALLPATCEMVASMPVELSVVAAGESEATRDGPALVAVARRFEPDVAPPRGGRWEPRAPGSATPSWAPSVFATSQLERLGAAVHLSYVDASRFDWVLRAGQRERPARGGATWVSELGPRRDQARLALPLASGLRRKPRGLRIDGVSGLPFRAGEALARGGRGPGRARGLPARGWKSSFAHASELRMTADGGQLLAAARERGPQAAPSGPLRDARGGHPAGRGGLRQPRGDGVDVARAGVHAFSRARPRAPSPRGSLSADGDARGPFERTTLVALDRVLGGRERSAESRDRCPRRHRRSWMA
jgi:hypothetical protein